MGSEKKAWDMLSFCEWMATCAPLTFNSWWDHYMSEKARGESVPLQSPGNRQASTESPRGGQECPFPPMEDSTRIETLPPDHPLLPGVPYLATDRPHPFVRRADGQCATCGDPEGHFNHV